MVGDARQGWALLAAMTVIFVGCSLFVRTRPSRRATRRSRRSASIQAASALAARRQHGGQGGALRHRRHSALWATATTAASNGSVNSMHDSFTPLGGLVPMWLMQLGEVVFGGVGSGLYGMLVFAIVAVFVAGLMVGRTPEYLGKKIEAFEMKMALARHPRPADRSCSSAPRSPSRPSAGRDGHRQPGRARLQRDPLRLLARRATTTAARSPASARTRPSTTCSLGVAMLVARYWVAVPVLAIAGSLAKKKLVPAGPGTLPTHTPLFVVLLVGDGARSSARSPSSPRSRSARSSSTCR